MKIKGPLIGHGECFIPERAVPDTPEQGGHHDHPHPLQPAAVLHPARRARWRGVPGARRRRRLASPQDVVGTSVSYIQGTAAATMASTSSASTSPAARSPSSPASTASSQDPADLLPIRLVPHERALPHDACFAGSVAYPPNPCVSDGWLRLLHRPAGAGQLYLLRRVCASTQDCVAEDPPFTIGFLTAPSLDAPTATVRTGRYRNPACSRSSASPCSGLWGLRIAVAPAAQETPPRPACEPPPITPPSRLPRSYKNHRVSDPL